MPHVEAAAALNFTDGTDALGCSTQVACNAAVGAHGRRKVDRQPPYPVSSNVWDYSELRLHLFLLSMNRWWSL